VKAGDKSAKTLPGLSKSADWDGKDVERGYKIRHHPEMSGRLHGSNEEHPEFIEPDSQSVVGTTMLVESHKFVTSLMSWINTFLGDRTNKGDDEQETIKHVLHDGHASRGPRPGMGPVRARRDARQAAVGHPPGDWCYEGIKRGQLLSSP
jgi:hypothetical protein